MNRKALVVGINTYTYLAPLNAPAADANAIADRLEQDGEFRVVRLPEAITQENGEERIPQVGSTLPVTQAQLKAQLKELFQPDSNQIPDTALFYFSGHGIPAQDGHDKGYLATSDTQPSADRFGISLGWLHWLLSESPIKQQIVWLDCCHSGSLLVNVQAANPGHEESCDRCFIASSRDYESSWQDLNSPYSVLTKALRDGLDPNRLAGRWIDSFALVDYVNQALRGELQSPVCTNFGDAINLTRSWQVESEPKATAIETDICPYKGLEYFDFNDEDPKYFFGREELAGQLLDKVRTSNFMALVGASGNGKSSVLRAGLLHQLKVGRRIAGSNQWQIRITRPDKTPLRNLALAFVDAEATGVDRAEQLGKAERLIELGADGLRRLVQTETASRVILVIDQFEEVFTRCEDLEAREQFFACLMGALAETDNKLCLVIAMRADFVGKCLERDYSGLAQLVPPNTVSVLPMNPDELKAAICKPAEQVGLQVESALVTEILNDIKGSPGYLPLLQYTLKELWQQRQNNQLVFSAYQKLGGIDGTLDKRATAIYNSFDPDEQRTVQHIFQQLTQLGEGTEDTRRRVLLDNLIAEPQHPAERVNQVIATLAAPENRLLVTSEVVSKGNDAERMAIVDVAHEALIRHWQLLRQWIEQNRDLLRQKHRIDASARMWKEHEWSKDYLLQGLPLIEAKQFQEKQAEQFPLSDLEKRFIQKSVWQRRWNRLKTASWLIPAILILGVVEHNLRESSAKADLARLDSESKYEEKQAVEDLVVGCKKQAAFSWLPDYAAERLFGNCRSLVSAPLQSANLRSANLISADLISADLSDAGLRYADLISANLFEANLSDADLSYADLISANLFEANLISANLSSADLSSADLSYADLRSADLSDALLIATDLRESENLTVEHLTGEEQPYLCGVAFPSNITDIESNRDCDALPSILVDRYSEQYGTTLEEAQQIIEEARNRQWD